MENKDNLKISNFAQVIRATAKWLKVLPDVLNTINHVLSTIPLMTTTYRYM